MQVFLGTDTLKTRPKQNSPKCGIWQNQLLFTLTAYSEWISAL